MKRKVAFFLALIMALSSMQLLVSASTTIRPRGSGNTSYGDTRFLEETGNTPANQLKYDIPTSGFQVLPNADYFVVSGTKRGDTFILVLEGDDAAWLGSGFPADGDIIRTDRWGGTTDTQNRNTVAGAPDNLQYYDLGAGWYYGKNTMVSNLGGGLTVNSIDLKGVYVRLGDREVVVDDLTGTRSWNDATGARAALGNHLGQKLPAQDPSVHVQKLDTTTNQVVERELAYTLVFIDDKTAVLTILEDSEGVSGTEIIKIPLVFKGKDKTSVYLRADSGTMAGTFDNSAPRAQVASGSGGGLSVEVKPVIYNYDTFPLHTIKFTESRFGSLKEQEEFTIEAEEGFEFVSTGIHNGIAPTTSWVPDDLTAIYNYKLLSGASISNLSVEDATGLLLAAINNMWQAKVSINGEFFLEVFDGTSLDPGNPDQWILAIRVLGDACLNGNFKGDCEQGTGHVHDTSGTPRPYYIAGRKSPTDRWQLIDFSVDSYITELIGLSTGGPGPLAGTYYMFDGRDFTDRTAINDNKKLAYIAYYAQKNGFTEIAGFDSILNPSGRLELSTPAWKQGILPDAGGTDAVASFLSLLEYFTNGEYWAGHVGTYFPTYSFSKSQYEKTNYLETILHYQVSPWASGVNNPQTSANPYDWFSGGTAPIGKKGGGTSTGNYLSFIAGNGVGTWEAWRNRNIAVAWEEDWPKTVATSASQPEITGWNVEQARDADKTKEFFDIPNDSAAVGTGNKGLKSTTTHGFSRTPYDSVYMYKTNRIAYAGNLGLAWTPATLFAPLAGSVGRSNWTIDAATGNTTSRGNYPGVLGGVGVAPGVGYNVQGIAGTTPAAITTDNFAKGTVPPWLPDDYPGSWQDRDLAVANLPQQYSVAATHSVAEPILSGVKFWQNSNPFYIHNVLGRSKYNSGAGLIDEGYFLLDWVDVEGTEDRVEMKYYILGTIGGNGAVGSTMTTHKREASGALKGYAVGTYQLAAQGNRPVIDMIKFGMDRNGRPDYKKAYLHYTGLIRSEKSQQWLEFKYLPLVLQAEENAPFGDVYVNVSVPDLGTHRVKAGVRADWGIKFETLEPVPTLYNGQFENYGIADPWHKSAKIRFEELLPMAWLSNRQTIFSVPEGVKITKVVFSNFQGDLIEPKLAAKDFKTGASYTAYYSQAVERDGDNVAIATDKTSGSVRVEEQQVILTGVTSQRTDQNKRSGFDVQFWLSIEPGYEGPIEIEASGSGVSGVGVTRKTFDNDGKVVVAEAKNPIIIDVSAVTDLKIGYQRQAAADFDITEARYGILRKGDRFKLSITDNVFVNTVSFTDALYDVTDGDLKINNKSIAQSAYTDSNAISPALQTVGSTGTISFDITAASSKPSTISFENVQVQIDRNAPESNTPQNEEIDRGYNLLAWGNAVANNYDATTNPVYGTFRIPGILEPYLRVATNAIGSALNSRVEVSEGSSTILINGKEYEIDVPAYINPETESFMVPVRFIAVALTENNMDSYDQYDPNGPVQWNDESRTVFINAPNRSIQFTIGSDELVVNGTKTHMTAVGNSSVSVQAEIQGERSFIPFRALGDALGVTVGWDPETRTAIFNP